MANDPIKGVYYWCLLSLPRTPDLCVWFCASCRRSCFGTRPTWRAWRGRPNVRFEVSACARGLIGFVFRKLSLGQLFQRQIFCCCTSAGLTFCLVSAGTTTTANEKDQEFNLVFWTAAPPSPEPRPCSRSMEQVCWPFLRLCCSSAVPSCLPTFSCLNLNLKSA